LQPATASGAVVSWRTLSHCLVLMVLMQGLSRWLLWVAAAALPVCRQQQRLAVHPVLVVVHTGQAVMVLDVLLQAAPCQHNQQLHQRTAKPLGVVKWPAQAKEVAGVRAAAGR